MGRPGVGPHVRHAIAFALDSLDEGLVGGLVGPRRAGRRHLAGAQLAQYLLPSGAVVVEVGEVQGLQVHRPCLGTDMAGVAIELPGLPNDLLIEQRMSRRGHSCGFFRRPSRQGTRAAAANTTTAVAASARVRFIFGSLPDAKQVVQRNRIRRSPIPRKAQLRLFFAGGKRVRCTTNGHRRLRPAGAPRPARNSDSVRKMPELVFRCSHAAVHSAARLDR